MGLPDPLSEAPLGTVAVMTDERNRYLLEQDERECGLAFVDETGQRVDPTKVFKSVANTYVDYQGFGVSLWKSETVI